MKNALKLLLLATAIVFTGNARCDTTSPQINIDQEIQQNNEPKTVQTKKMTKKEQRRMKQKMRREKRRVERKQKSPKEPKGKSFIGRAFSTITAPVKALFKKIFSGNGLWVIAKVALVTIAVVGSAYLLATAALFIGVATGSAFLVNTTFPIVATPWIIAAVAI